MSVSIAGLQAARLRMKASRQALKDYEDGLSASPPDRKQFRRLYAKAQVYAEEYLTLLTRHLNDKYCVHIDKTAKGAPRNPASTARSFA